MLDSRYTKGIQDDHNTFLWFFAHTERKLVSGYLNQLFQWHLTPFSLHMHQYLSCQDIIPSIIPEDHWFSSQTQFQQFLHTITNQGMDYCLRNMETTKTLQKIKAGQNLFHHIHQRITLRQENTTGTSRKLNLSLIREIQKSLQKQGMVNILHVNAHSITNKVSQFQLESCSGNIDICAITETWIKQNDIDAMTKEVLLHGNKSYLDQEVVVKLEVA